MRSPTRHVLARLAAMAVAHPRAVLGMALLASLLAGFTAAGRLELLTSNLDLIDPHLPQVQRFRAFAEEFGTPNVLVVVFEGDDPAALRRAVDLVGPRLAAAPGARGAAYRLPTGPGLPLGTMAVNPYFTSRDGKMAFAFVQPDDPHSRAATLEPFVRGVRTLLVEADLASLGVTAGLTGMPAYALDDRETIQRDLTWLSVVSVSGILLLFAAGFGSMRRPLLAVLALAVGVTATLGLAALWPGHLTLLSAFFTSILFGLGIDAGIHLIGRIEELVAKGATEAEAIVRAADELGPGLTSSTATTAAAFATLAVSGFKGFAELGAIAAVGMVVCLLAMSTVLPSLLVLIPQRKRAAHRFTVPGLATWCRHPELAMALSLLAVAGLAVGPPTFDTDYLNLEPEGSTAVRLEREMVRRSGWSPEFAVFVAADRDEVTELTRRLRAEPTVGAVRSAADLEALAALTGVSLADEPMLENLKSERGRWAVYAYPLEDVWQPAAQQAFVHAMQAIDPEVTGMPILGRFMVERSLRALGISGVLGAFGILALVFADLRRLRPTFLALLPTALTIPALLGLMHLAGLAFNPLDVLALPIILGIAVDDGIHLVHRFLAESGDLTATLAGAGRSVVLTSLTTLAGFGAIGFSAHRGLASFGQVVSLGVGAALVLSLLVLPALLAVNREALTAPRTHGPQPVPRAEPAPATFSRSAR